MGIEPILSNIASIILQCMWLDLPYSKGHLHTMFSYEPTHLPILEIKVTSVSEAGISTISHATNALY